MDFDKLIEQVQGIDISMTKKDDSYTENTVVQLPIKDVELELLRLKVEGSKVKVCYGKEGCLCVVLKSARVKRVVAKGKFFCSFKLDALDEFIALMKLQKYLQVEIESLVDSDKVQFPLKVEKNKKLSEVGLSRYAFTCSATYEEKAHPVSDKEYYPVEELAFTIVCVNNDGNSFFYFNKRN